MERALRHKEILGEEPRALLPTASVNIGHMREDTMKDFKDKVAVITGAASGIGRGLAERCADEGMRIVLADIEESALATAETEMAAHGATVLAVRTDVSDADSVETLAQTTLETFGAVHLLCNNAGVIVAGSTWENTLRDWEWVMGVNLWGVIHGIHVFVPIMLDQRIECHVVNTASIAGLVSPRIGNAIYAITKHGVVALSESLYHELAAKDASIGVSVLCPGFVKTRLVEAERNRAAELRNEPPNAAGGTAEPTSDTAMQGLAWAISRGIERQQVSELVFTAVREKRFYVLVNADPWRQALKARVEGILQERNPTIPALDLA